MDNTKDNKDIFQKYCLKTEGNKYYPTVMPKADRIIAIGDLHGDWDLTIRVLKLARLINDNLKWIGGNTVLVQVGDQLDNCRPLNKKCDDPESANSMQFDEPQDLKVVNYLTNLQHDAELSGGTVILLLGNHELMNVDGNMSYVSYNDVIKFKGGSDSKDNYLKKLSERKEAFGRGNKYAKIFACTRLPAVIVGSFIFAHAGFISKFLNQADIKSRDDLYKISYLMKKWLLNLLDKDNMMSILKNPQTSLFWDRILGSIPPNVNMTDSRCVEHLSDVLHIFDVNGMVVGHTPQVTNNKGINSTCDDKLWRIDFAGSFSFNKFDKTYLESSERSEQRTIQCLEILNDTQLNILHE